MSAPREVLDVDKLAELVTAAARPRWVAQIRDAEELETRATPYVSKGQVYVMNPPALGTPDRTRVLVVCHPSQLEQVDALVRELRNPEGLL